jgi:hypothetical protein
VHALSHAVHLEETTPVRNVLLQQRRKGNLGQSRGVQRNQQLVRATRAAGEQGLADQRQMKSRTKRGGLRVLSCTHHQPAGLGGRRGQPGNQRTERAAVGKGEHAVERVDEGTVQRELPEQGQSLARLLVVWEGGVVHCPVQDHHGARTAGDR